MTNPLLDIAAPGHGGEAFARAMHPTMAADGAPFLDLERRRDLGRGFIFRVNDRPDDLRLGVCEHPRDCLMRGSLADTLPLRCWQNAKDEIVGSSVASAREKRHGIVRDQRIILAALYDLGSIKGHVAERIAQHAIDN